jgi:hypothetical protein
MLKEATPLANNTLRFSRPTTLHASHPHQTSSTTTTIPPLGSVVKKNKKHNIAL